MASESQQGLFPIKAGDEFGFLTATDMQASNDWGNTMVLCRCTCGELEWKRANHLRNGVSTFCRQDCPDMLRSKVMTVPIRYRLTLANHIATVGGEWGFVPTVKCDPVDYPPGSPEKIEELRRRVANGSELWQDGDAVDFEGTSAGFLQPSQYSERRDFIKENDDYE